MTAILETPVARAERDPRLFQQQTMMGNTHLHAAITEAGLTYGELADRLGVDPKTVERWVNDPSRRPYARHAQAVARILGTDMWDLWPAQRRTQATPAPVLQTATRTAHIALARAESLDLSTAGVTEMALHLGALSTVLRTVLDVLDGTAEAVETNTHERLAGARA
ncbi:helix-turn-helix transcriptional regulator [Streptomyces klenkii]|uniref:helix-turn-helix transcriptional regulator n=1 Tax=Streptomyces klenkii TaxID=1420899 RepID=UPI0033BAE414